MEKAQRHHDNLVYFALPGAITCDPMQVKPGANADANPGFTGNPSRFGGALLPTIGRPSISGSRRRTFSIFFGMVMLELPKDAPCEVPEGEKHWQPSVTLLEEPLLGSLCNLGVWRLISPLAPQPIRTPPHSPHRPPHSPHRPLPSPPPIPTTSPPPQHRSCFRRRATRRCTKAPQRRTRCSGRCSSTGSSRTKGVDQKVCTVDGWEIHFAPL